MTNTKTKLQLGTFQLKLIAIIAMTIDYIAWSFVPVESIPAFVMHTIGRVTAPIMCFCLAEGYAHTKSVGRYFRRLSILTVISAWAYSFYESGGFIEFYGFGMIFTLFLGLLAIHIWNQKEWLYGVRILLVAICCIASMMGDWPVLGVLWPLFFYIFREDESKKYIFFIISGVISAASFLIVYWGDWGLMAAQLCQFGVLLAIPILKCYNGKKGCSAEAWKWLFYIYYPLLLFVLGMISLMFA